MIIFFSSQKIKIHWCVPVCECFLLLKTDTIYFSLQHNMLYYSLILVVYLYLYGMSCGSV